MLGIIFFYRLRYKDHSPIVKEYKKLNEQNKRENFMKVFLAFLLPERIYRYYFLKEGIDVATPPVKKPLHKQSWATMKHATSSMLRIWDFSPGLVLENP